MSVAEVTNQLYEDFGQRFNVQNTNLLGDYHNTLTIVTIHYSLLTSRGSHDEFERIIVDELSSLSTYRDFLDECIEIYEHDKNVQLEKNLITDRFYGQRGVRLNGTSEKLKKAMFNGDTQKSFDEIDHAHVLGLITYAYLLLYGHSSTNAEEIQREFMESWHQRQPK